MAKSPRKLAAALTLRLVAALPPGTVTKAAGATGGLTIPVSVLENLATQFFEVQQQAGKRVDRMSRQVAALHDALAALQSRGLPAPQQPAVHGFAPLDPEQYRLSLMRAEPPPPRNGHDHRFPQPPPGLPPFHPEASP
jgi:hypothetical protein